VLVRELIRVARVEAERMAREFVVVAFGSVVMYSLLIGGSGDAPVRVLAVAEESQIRLSTKIALVRKSKEPETIARSSADMLC